jgi:membrane fusion protein (multidrug efflux system)
MIKIEEPTIEVVKTNGEGHKVEIAPAPRKTMNNKGRFAILGAVATLAVIVALIPVIHSAFIHESTDDAFIDGHIIGIAPKVAGEVLAVHVEDNQLIKEGDPIIEIDPRDYEAKLAEERGKVGAAEAEAKRAVADAVRYEQLLRQDEISQQQLDNAKAAAASAVATVAKERGALQQEELNLSYTKITAPEAGRITRKSVEAGSYVQVGQGILAIVPENVWVTANFKETQLTHMHPGQKVDIKVDAFPKLKLEGHVDSIQSGTGSRFSLLPPENASGNYVKVVQRVPVKIVIDTPADPNFKLSPGMSVVPSVDIR